MRRRHVIGRLASFGLGIGLLTFAPASATAASTASPTVVQGNSSVASPANQVAATPASTPIDFDVSLQLSDPSGAASFEQAVSDPTSPTYRHFLTPAQWENRFSPNASTVSSVTSWLLSQGITVTGVSADRMTVEASASASTVQHAFGTTLNEYRHLGKVLRLAATPLKVPASVASLITGVTGVDQHLATPNGLTGAKRLAAKKAPSAEEIPQPPGFRNAPPVPASTARRAIRPIRPMAAAIRAGCPTRSVATHPRSCRAPMASPRRLPAASTARA